MKRLYFILAVIGAVIPWLFFGSFFSQNGLALIGFVRGLFANGAAGGFSADVLISIFVFWIWSYRDGIKNSIRHWWLVLPASFFVGLSLAMPLYFYMREA